MANGRMATFAGWSLAAASAGIMLKTSAIIEKPKETILRLIIFDLSCLLQLEIVAPAGWPGLVWLFLRAYEPILYFVQGNDNSFFAVIFNLFLVIVDRNCVMVTRIHLKNTIAIKKKRHVTLDFFIDNGFGLAVKESLLGGKGCVLSHQVLA
jgi:hypothetical protein